MKMNWKKRMSVFLVLVLVLSCSINPAYAEEITPVEKEELSGEENSGAENSGEMNSSTEYSVGEQPESPVCICDTKCAGDVLNKECPVCGAENADLTLCTGNAEKVEAEKEETEETKEKETEEAEEIEEEVHAKLLMAAAKANAATYDVSKGNVVIDNTCGSSCKGHTIIGKTTQYNVKVTGSHTITLNNTTIDVSGKNSTTAIDLSQAGACTITLQSGTTNTLKAGDDSAGVCIPSSNLITFNGSGTLNVTGGYNWPGIGGATDDGNIKITSGTIIAAGGRFGASGIGGSNGFTGGKIVITGGTIKATGGSMGAGIGGGGGRVAGEVIIEGGSVTAQGGGMGGAGIGGGGRGAGGTITIRGGEVTATGGDYGAGIGGGDRPDEFEELDFGTVIIEGGTVHATGGEKAAGIGGGSGRSGGTIEIRKGDVTATGGKNGGAGIGGGERNFGGTITILNGTVRATGGPYGAGIGGGRGGSSGKITIENGTVTATSQEVGFPNGAAGIGGGDYAGADEIIIRGGTIDAKGASRAAAIGGGSNGAAGIITISGGNIKAFTAVDNGHPAAIGTGAWPKPATIANVNSRITISGGVIDARGGGMGISAQHESENGGTVEITGGVITATGIAGPNSNLIFQGGTVFLIKGAEKYPSYITACAICGSGLNKNNWEGIVFEGDNFKENNIAIWETDEWEKKTGKVYGNVTLTEDFEIPAGYKLTNPKGNLLIVDKNAKLINNGSIENEGIIRCYGELEGMENISGSGYVLKDESAVKVTFANADSGKTEIAYGDTVIVTATMIQQQPQAQKLSRAVSLGEVDFYCGDVETGTELGTSNVTDENGEVLATLSIPLTGEDWKPGTYTITADFGGYTPYFESEGSASFTVVQAEQTAPASGEGYSIDYVAETITANQTYELAAANTDTTGTDTLKVTPGSKVYVRKEGTELYKPSSWTEVTVPARPTAPNAAAETTASTITLTANDKWEYSADKSDWNNISKFINLDAGQAKKYYVRVKATDSSFASEIQTVETATNPASYTVSIPSGIKTVPQSGTADIGNISITEDDEHKFDLGYNGKVNVSVSAGVDAQGNITLKRTDDEQTTITSKLTANGNICGLNQILSAYTQANKTDQISLKLAAPVYSGEKIPAGEYSGNVTFLIVYTEQ